jgi:lipid-binding SYLF domain-containing protein
LRRLRLTRFVREIAWNGKEVFYEEIRNCFVNVVFGRVRWSGQQDTSARLQAASQVMNEIMAAPDKGIPEEVLNGAKCIAVVPDMAKGGFIVGGEHGRGVVTCRTAHGWSAPAFISIGGGNFGFQAGGQSVDLVMLFMNDKGMQGLLSSKFELTGEASATAGPVGRHASAGTTGR